METLSICTTSLRKMSKKVLDTMEDQYKFHHMHMVSIHNTLKKADKIFHENQTTFWT